MNRNTFEPVKPGTASGLGAAATMRELLADSDGFRRTRREARFRMWVAASGIAAFLLFCLMMVR